MATIIFLKQIHPISLSVNFTRTAVDLANELFAPNWLFKLDKSLREIGLIKKPSEILEQDLVKIDTEKR